ncbi:cytochrome c oxidase subunit 20 [Malassezia restricta]|uniref:cytochrome c oxidase subunit 20 n=1 Tax=Malassezia restricta TaxID=76775 RepID=UPI000DD11793|nr:cytochrome c oxidase subunit 20 [Malassezia restricta]AXA51787.1 cytochrome c oxidase subunit 20 [Malassezia restricta]
MATRGWTPSMTEATPSRLVDIPLETTKKPSYTDALRQFSLTNELQRLPHVPCARTTLLMGMATGAAVGTIQVIFGRGIMRSMNWAVGSFVCISVLGWYVVCSSPAGRHVVDRTRPSRRACMTLLYSTKSDWKVVVTMYRHLNQA